MTSMSHYETCGICHSAVCSHSAAKGLRPLVSLCVTAYDRYEQLRACIESFFMTNEYENVELVVVDNASPDERIKEYLRTLSVYLRTLSIPVKDYRLVTRTDNAYPFGQKQSRIDARNAAKGEYFIDCPDDHLFVVKSNWIQECIEHIRRSDAAAMQGLCKRVGCVVHYAQPLYRFQKANNESQLAYDRPDKFRESLHKGYADYHIMSVEAYREIGEFDASLGRECEGEYMARAHVKGFRRHVMNYPVAVLNERGYQLVEPLMMSGIMRRFAAMVQLHPVPTEELWAHSIGVGAISVDGLKPHNLPERYVDEWLG